MTIGIAAFGPSAGLAIIEGLKAAEAVGQGALHGFVSIVAIGQNGLVHRAEVQDGGTAALLAGGPLPDGLASATRAGLMSSGPNRPSPLSQFTPADPAVGLVTGHRFPNVIGVRGAPLNLEVLELMRRGVGPEAAVSSVVVDNPLADAGFIALSHDGRVHAQNSPYLSGFGDAGQAMVSSPDGGTAVAVLHNAIRPHRALATLVAEVVRSILIDEHAVNLRIVLHAGVTLRLGAVNAIDVDDDDRVLAIEIGDERYLSGAWTIGLGYRSVVRRRGVPVGRALYEPFLRISNGTISTVDGVASVLLPIQFI